MAEHASVVRVTTFTTDDQRRDRLVAALLRIVDGVRQSEGCFGGQVCSVENRSDAVAAVSRWRSRADVDSYLSGHRQEISEAVDGLLAAAPETVHLISLD